MSLFNIGYMCKNCGPVKEAKERSINKVKHKCCKECDGIVHKWERPLNERAGRCNNCAAAAFTNEIIEHRLVRECKQCGERYDTDQNIITRKGDRKYEYKQ